MEVRPTPDVDPADVARLVAHIGAHLDSSRADAAERRAFEALPPDAQAALLADGRRCQDIADRLLDDLQAVISSLHGFAEDEHPCIVDTQNRVKSAYSMARTVGSALKLRPTSLHREIFENNKDRVRFSVTVAESSYGSSVSRVLRALEARGYSVRDTVSFWARTARHNGLNVTVQDADGFNFELQFPTEYSRQAGKASHRLYRILRLDQSSVQERVESFLAILAINKICGMERHQPQGLADLNVTRSVNSTFSEWLRKDADVWALYSLVLEDTGTTFEDVLARYGLDRNDVFGSPEGAT